MPSNSPPPRAHKSRTSEVLPDLPQRLPQLTAGGNSNTVTSPQKPSSSSGTCSIGSPLHRAHQPSTSSPCYKTALSSSPNCIPSALSSPYRPPLPLQPPVSTIPVTTVKKTTNMSPNTGGGSVSAGRRQRAAKSIVFASPPQQGEPQPSPSRTTSTATHSNTTTAATAPSVLPPWAHLDFAALSGFHSLSSRLTGLGPTMAARTVYTARTPVQETMTTLPPSRLVDDRTSLRGGAVENPQSTVHHEALLPKKGEAEDTVDKNKVLTAMITAQNVTEGLSPSAPLVPTSPSKAGSGGGGGAPMPDAPFLKEAPSVLQPPPLTRTASTATLHNSACGLAPLIEWVPVPGWDDTEMCRGVNGGYFKADATTGRPYRVNWVRQRDLSRPPTMSSSGMRTPVSPSPLPLSIGMDDVIVPPPLSAVAHIEEQRLTLKRLSPITVGSTPISGCEAEKIPVGILPVHTTTAAGAVANIAREREKPRNEVEEVAAAANTTTPLIALQDAPVSVVDSLRRLLPPATSPLAHNAKVPPPQLNLNSESAEAAPDPENIAPSYLYQWLGFSNKASGAGYNDDKASAPLCIPLETMVRRSLPVVSDGYDVHGCSVFTGVRKDGTVSVVMLEPYPGRTSSTTPSPLFSQQHQEKEKTCLSISLPHSSMPLVSPQRPQQIPPQQQPRGRSLSTGPVQRSRTGSPTTNPTKTTVPDPMTTAATTASSISCLLSSKLGFTLTSPPRVPTTTSSSRQPQRQQPSQSQTQSQATPPIRLRGRSVANSAPVVMPQQTNVEGDRAALSLNAAVVALHGGRTNNAAAAAGPPSLLPTSQGMLWSPLAPAALTASTPVKSHQAVSGGGGTPHLPPPPSASYFTPSPPDPTPQQSTTVSGTRPSTTVAPTAVVNNEITAFVNAAARAHGPLPPPAPAAAVAVSPNTAITLEANTTCNSPLSSSKRRRSLSHHRAPITADIVPLTKPLPRLSVAALSLVEPPNEHRSTSKATPSSLLPSWCLNLVDALLTPFSTDGGGAVHQSSPQFQLPRPQQQTLVKTPHQQRVPSAPTTVSTSATTTAGSDLDSNMWSVETRNGIPIGWTLKSVTAAGRAAAAAAAEGKSILNSTVNKPEDRLNRPSSNDQGGARHTLSSPLLFALATPDAAAVQRANSKFLRSVSRPQVETTAAGAELAEDKGNVRRRPPTTTAHQTEEEGVLEPAVPNTAEKPFEALTQPQKEQRRFTRTSIMTHSGLNVQESVNGVDANVPANRPHGHTYNNGAETLVNALSTDVAAGTATTHPSRAAMSVSPTGLSPPQLQATSSTAAATATAQERQRMRDLELSIALTLSQFQSYHPQQQRRQRAAATERLLDFTGGTGGGVSGSGPALASAFLSRVVEPSTPASLQPVGAAPFTTVLSSAATNNKDHEGTDVVVAAPLLTNPRPSVFILPGSGEEAQLAGQAESEEAVPHAVATANFTTATTATSTKLGPRQPTQGTAESKKSGGKSPLLSLTPADVDEQLSIVSEEHAPSFLDVDAPVKSTASAQQGRQTDIEKTPQQQQATAGTRTTHVPRKPTTQHAAQQHGRPQARPNN